jgi:hypothetical protein
MAVPAMSVPRRQGHVYLGQKSYKSACSVFRRTAGYPRFRSVSRDGCTRFGSPGILGKFGG